MIKQNGSISLLTDGERRYGNLLFETFYDIFRVGRPGRPAKRLPKGVRVKLKNKGSKKRPGRRRKKYQTPVPAYPETQHQVADSEIHANLVEAFNASLRRRNAAFRCKRTSMRSLGLTYNEHWMSTGSSIILFALTLQLKLSRL